MNRIFKCANCGAEFEEPFGTGRPTCPKCGSDNVFRIDEYKGAGGGMGRGMGRGLGRGTGRGMGRGMGMGRGRGWNF